jgi:hypothetical protein|tara:strand:+ start:4901 stop:5743 length:843 start_codon:yes stop_codon:yes gene_type:complete
MGKSTTSPNNLGIMIEHNYTKDFDTLKSKLESKENFAFSRFSDGEGFILYNQYLELSDSGYNLNGARGYAFYGKEEHKVFDPDKHSFFRDKLIESLEYVAPNYYKGLPMKDSCPAFDGIFDEIVENAGGDSEYLSFANLWNNANYPRFIEELVPILSKRKVVFICNKDATLDELPFKVVKDFRIGSNAMIENYSIIEEIKEYVSQNNIENHVFLCSAASLSNLIVHQCFEANSSNTFIDIGSTLNPLMGLKGWTGTRTYLNQYWNSTGDRSQLEMVDTWA